MKVDALVICAIVIPTLGRATKDLFDGEDKENFLNEKDTFQTWSESVYDSLVQMANWAKVSYCTVLNPDFTEGELSEFCPNLEFCKENSGVVIEEIFRPSLSGREISGTGYVAVDREEKIVYLVFRGSISLGDWLTDFMFAQCPYAPVLKNDLISAKTFSNITSETEAKVISAMIQDNAVEQPCANCKVHCGIYIAYVRFIKEAEQSVKKYTDKGYQLKITGHSLGGGFAYLAGIDFLLSGYNPQVVTFASLRIGDPAWNLFVDEQFDTAKNAKVVFNGGDLPIPSLTRVYQKTDLVPRLPPRLPGLPTYTHSGLEFMINKLTLPQTQADIEFRGATDNHQNPPFQFELSDRRAITEAYQHIHNLVRLFLPCNDWESPFRSKREDDAIELMCQ